MPRYSLSKVPIQSLQAEIERRVSKLAGLLKLRDDVDRQIAELKALAGQFAEAAPAAPKVKVGRRKRRKAKTVKKVVLKKPRKAFKQTAQKFILRLLKGGAMTTAQLNERWKRIGRGGKADKTLGGMVAAGSIKREKLKGGRGSEYSVA